MESLVARPAAVAPWVGLLAPTAAELGLVREAAEAWAGARLAVADDAETLLREPGCGLLLTGRPTPALIARVAAAQDAAGLPRCGLVTWGGGGMAAAGGPEAADVVHTPCSEEGLRCALPLAWRLLEQRRLLARQHGDLWTLARRITHDLRSPLGSLLTGAEMLHEILQDEAAAHAPLVPPLVESAQEAVTLLDRVSFVTRASLHAPETAPVDMGEAFFQAREQLERALQRRGLAVEEPAGWPVVPGVRAWLPVVWWNLLHNALTHAAGARRLTAGWEQEPGGTRFWLHDDGAGVAPDRRAGLFQPFHRLHQGPAARGVGLSLVQRLVELQGGRCWFEAPPGGGSCFSFTLPEGAAPSRSR